MPKSWSESDCQNTLLFNELSAGEFINKIKVFRDNWPNVWVYSFYLSHCFPGPETFDKPEIINDGNTSFQLPLDRRRVQWNTLQSQGKCVITYKYPVV